MPPTDSTLPAISFLPPIRRIVTGHDKNNVAKVLMDGPATNHRESRPGSRATLIWSSDATHMSTAWPCAAVRSASSE